MLQACCPPPYLACHPRPRHPPLRRAPPQVAVGNGHMLGLTATGQVLTWGKGDYGRCGNGRSEQPVPEPVDLLRETMCVQVRDSAAARAAYLALAPTDACPGHLGSRHAGRRWAAALAGSHGRWARVRVGEERREPARAGRQHGARSGERPPYRAWTTPSPLIFTQVMDLNTFEGLPLVVEADEEEAPLFGGELQPPPALR